MNLIGALLAQFILTPTQYKARFINASKTADEAHTLFKARCLTSCYTTFEVDRPKAIASAWLTFWLAIS